MYDFTQTPEFEHASKIALKERLNKLRSTFERYQKEFLDRAKTSTADLPWADIAANFSKFDEMQLNAIAAYRDQITVLEQQPIKHQQHSSGEQATQEQIESLKQQNEALIDNAKLMESQMAALNDKLERAKILENQLREQIVEVKTTSNAIQMDLEDKLDEADQRADEKRKIT